MGGTEPCPAQLLCRAWNRPYISTSDHGPWTKLPLALYYPSPSPLYTLCLIGSSSRQHLIGCAGHIEGLFRNSIELAVDYLCKSIDRIFQFDIHP